MSTLQESTQQDLPASNQEQEDDSLKTKLTNLIQVKNKSRILLALHHRGKLSMVPHSSFHWSILIVPKTSLGHDAHNIDVTDASIINPLTSTDENPTHEWCFRNQAVDVRTLPRLVAMGVLVKLDGRAMATRGEVGRILRDIALQRREVEGENCQSWVLSGLKELHHVGIFGRKAMDFEKVFGIMQREAERRVKEGDLGEVTRLNVLELTGRRCEVFFEGSGAGRGDAEFGKKSVGC